MPDRLRILGVSGSVRPGSHSLQALRIALDAAGAEDDVVTHLYNPAEHDLPWCYGKATPAQEEERDRWKRLVAESDGIILSTPEYHGSFSGILKNAIDLVGFDEMEDKVVGLISVLGGGANSNALNQLRIVCRWVHAWVIPHQAAVGAAYDAFDENGRLRNEKLQLRVERVGTDVVKFARRLRNPDPVSV